MRPKPYEWSPQWSPQLLQLSRELLALKARGIIANVWIDAGTVRVSWPDDPDTRWWLTHSRAWRLVAAHRKAAA